MVEVNRYAHSDKASERRIAALVLSIHKTILAALPLNWVLYVMRIIVAVVLLYSVAVSAEPLVYRISDECIEQIEVKAADSRTSWEIRIELNSNQAFDFASFTESNIGKKLLLTNGKGRALGIPLATIQSAMSSQFRIAGFTSKSSAQSSVSLLKSEGVCGAVI